MTLNGFRLIYVNDDGDYTILHYEAGMIEHSPAVKYRTEKQNAFDPSYIHRRGAYREDDFTLSTPMTPQEYDELLYFLLQDGKFYLEFEREGSRVKQYPVEFDELPEASDNLNEWPDMVELTAVARFVSHTFIIFPGPASPETYTQIVDHMGELITDHTGEAILAYYE